MSPARKTHNQIDHILVDRRRHSSVLDVQPFRATDCDTDYDVNLLGDNIDTINKDTETSIGASKEVSLEINVEKTKYMLLSRHKNVD
jgi:hypothetical protein